MDDKYKAFFIDENGRIASVKEIEAKNKREALIICDKKSQKGLNLEELWRISEDRRIY